MKYALRIFRPASVITVACLVLLPITASAGLSAYLYLSGITGTGQSVNFANSTPIQSFHFGVCNPGGTNPRFTTLRLTKTADQNSPILAQLAASGGYLPTATLLVASASGQQLYQLQLDNVWVTSLCATNSPTGEQILEKVGLNCSKMTWTYTQYAASGVALSNSVAAYDLLYGKLPTVLSASGAQNPGNGTMDVTWNARSGATYNVLASPQAQGPYSIISTVTTTNLGPFTITLPASGDSFFYQLQEVQP